MRILEREQLFQELLATSRELWNEKRMDSISLMFRGRAIIVPVEKVIQEFDNLPNDDVRNIIEHIKAKICDQAADDDSELDFDYQ